jgi:uncharacterized protein (DUF1810 family)
MECDMKQSLERFVLAQASQFEAALNELEHGKKDGHWMWFIFPQLRGLGSSEKATYYGLQGAAEARDYLQHPILGPRLARATRAVLDAAVPLEELLGDVDALKFASCMTLFAAVTDAGSLYAQARDGLSGVDEKTRMILNQQENGHD